jgi:GAF domain-containing protein
MTDRDDTLLTRLAQLASEVGPAIKPSGHDELLKSITTVAVAIFRAAACSVALLDETTDELVFHVASGAGEEDVVGLRMPAQQGVAGWVLMSGQPIAIDDVRGDPRFAADVAESTGFVPHSIMAMPLETTEGTIGVVSVLDRSSADAGDMELLALFAQQAAIAIENSRAFSDLGRVLLAALEQAVEDGDLSDALRRASSNMAARDSDLAELAACFSELSAFGPDERRAAVALLSQFLSYVRKRRHWA